MRRLPTTDSQARAPAILSSHERSARKLGKVVETACVAVITSRVALSPSSRRAAVTETGTTPIWTSLCGSSPWLLDPISTVTDLTGRQLVGVRYFPLVVGDRGEFEVWDFGTWHQPTMGVELRMVDGVVFSAVWGWSFGHFGVELLAQPMEHLLNPEANRPVSVDSHRCWASVIGKTVVTGQG